MEVVNERCAGLDVHKKVVVACVLTPDEVGADGQPTPVLRRFGTMTEDLVALAGWLAERGVVRVAMESTGVYWQPVVRHEALLNREGMREPLQWAVAAVR